MSIYPVRVKNWFPIGSEEHSLVKYLVSNGFGDLNQGCLFCKKKHLHWQTAYAHHSLPFGYGDMWCNKRHLERYFEKINKNEKTKKIR